jgi:small-conductance mechanosensitive channel
LLLPLAAAAQEPQAGAPRTDAPALEKLAPVNVDGEMLFMVRGITAYPAHVRATTIEERILEAARNPAIDPGSVRAEPRGEHFALLAGDEEFTILVRADAEAEGIALDALAEYAARRTAAAIVRYREDRSPDALARAGVMFGVYTLLLVGIIWLMRLSRRKVEALVDTHVAEGVEAIERKSRRIIHSAQLWPMIRGAMRALYTLVVLIVAYFYLEGVLGSFPWTRWLAAELLWLVMTPLSYMGRAIASEIPNVAFLVILFFVFRYLIYALRLYFRALALGQFHWRGFEREWAMPTYRIIRVLVIAFGVVIAYPYIPGSDSAAFKGVSIFLGLIFSLGSTSFISNMIAGLTMTYRGAYREGDWVKIGDAEGKVLEMRMMVMRLQTRKNERVTIPNSVILNSNVVNYSAGPSRGEDLVIHTQVGIGYDVPWRQVETLLIRAALDTPGLRDEPAPFVHQKSLGDFAVVYEINAMGADPARLPRTYTQLHQNIQDRFNEAGIQIMSPAYVADPEQPKVVPPERWQAMEAETRQIAEDEPEPGKA